MATGALSHDEGSYKFPTTNYQNLMPSNITRLAN